MPIEHAGLTDVGMRRDHNEDSYCTNADHQLYIVCDGMGGHAAGEVASRIAVETVEKFTSATGNDADITWPFEYDENLSLNANRIRTAIRLANQNLIAHIQERKEYKGMGTTIVCSIVNGADASFGHVGDSRIYLIRKGEIRQLTRDHSWIDEQIKQGILTLEEARKHPLRNVITRALGSKDDVVVDVMDTRLEDEDILLLCSDGLTGMLEDREILQVVDAHKADLAAACKALIENANAHGGDDNVTAVLLRYRDGARSDGGADQN
jgi:protein phosphatase